MSDLTDHERILQLEWKVKQLNKFNKDRKSRDRWIVGSILTIAGVVAVFIVAYVPAHM
jgi:hypothetical protein